MELTIYDNQGIKNYVNFNELLFLQSFDRSVRIGKLGPAAMLDKAFRAATGGEDFIGRPVGYSRIEVDFSGRNTDKL